MNDEECSLPLSKRRLALRLASTDEERWVCSFQVLAEGKPALLTLENMRAIMEAPYQRPFLIAAHLISVIETSPTLIQQEYIDLIIKEKEGFYFARTLCLLFSNGPELLSPENIAVIRETAPPGHSIAGALITLLEADPSLLTDKNRRFLVEASKKSLSDGNSAVFHIARIIAFLFKTDPRLLTPENYANLLNSASTAKEIDLATHIFFEFNKKLLTQKKFDEIILQGDNASYMAWYKVWELEGKKPQIQRALAVACSYGLISLVGVWWWKGFVLGVLTGVGTSIFLGGVTYLVSFHGPIKFHERSKYNKKRGVNLIDYKYERFFDNVFSVLWTMGIEMKDRPWSEAPGIFLRWVLYYPFEIISNLFNLFLDFLDMAQTVDIFGRKKRIGFYEYVDQLAEKLKIAGEKEWAAQIRAAVSDNCFGSEILMELRAVINKLSEDHVSKKLKLERPIEVIMKSIERAL